MGHQLPGNSRRKPVTTAFLAAACAGMLSSTAAQATPFAESSDFGNDFSSRNTVPAGTDFVQGTLRRSPDDLDDYFKLTGLTPGPLTVRYTASSPATTFSLDVEARNDTDFPLNGGYNLVVGPGDGVISGSFGINVPGDGVVVGHTHIFEGGTGSLAYTFAVPEPSSAAALAGLSALALLGRRKSHPPEVNDKR